MKILAFLLLTFTAAAQNPLADVKLKTHQTNAGPVTTIDSVGVVWKNRRDIYPVHGTVYDFALEDDTARYQHNPPGKRLRGRTTYYDPAIGFPNEPPPPPVESSVEINNTNSSMVYSAGWNPSSAPWTQKFLNGDATWTATRGATVSYNFTGTKVAVVAEVCDNHGIAKVYILKGATVIQTAEVNMYKSTGTATNPATQTNACPNGERAVIFTSNEFPKDNYWVRVELFVVDTAPTPDRNTMVFDNFIVYSK